MKFKNIHASLFNFLKDSVIADWSRILMLLLLLAPLISSCGWVSPKPSPPSVADEQFKIAPHKGREEFANAAMVQSLSQSVSNDYLIGPGDVLKISVWHRPELNNNNIVVSPDGIIAITRVGQINVKGKSLAEVTKDITERLSKYYEKPEVTISIEKFNNNKVFVLGRVTSPGVVHFPGQGTLLEALALAGGLPVLQKDAFLSKCSIIRGKDKVIWVDLRELLEKGNMALNARLQNNDIVFIPESEDELVYVMGEVLNPQAIRLKTKLTYMDALMMSGGPSKEANLTKTYLIRFDGEKGNVQEINLAKMLKTGLFTQNFLLKNNDVVYVAPQGIAKLNYVMKQLLPSMAVLDLGTTIMEKFGIMDQIRQGLWGMPGSGGTGSSISINPTGK